MTPRRSYIICATPRSGSTLLCSLLRSSGVAGQPESWFRLQNRPDWAADWGIADSAGDFTWPDYLRAATAAGTGPNGVLGLRLMWNMLGELVADLGGAPPGAEAALLAQTFGPARFIHLTRRDLVAQAVSRHKAEVSGTWHLGFEEATDPATPTYDTARIRHYIDEARADNHAWQAWFTAENLSPFRVAYEDLAAAPAQVATAVLTALGLTAPTPLNARNRRMSDGVSGAWAARFRAENPGFAP